MPVDRDRSIRTAALVAGVLAAHVAWAVDIQYVYDSDGQLLEIIRDDGWHIMLDYDEAGNLIAQDVEPTTSADISIDLSDIPDPVKDGAVLTYVSTITNSGPNAATDVTLSMEVADFTPVQALTASQGTCTTDPATACDLGTLAAGESATATAEVIAAGARILDVTARATTLVFDPDTGNNVDVESTVVTSEVGPQIYLTLGQLETGQYGHRYGSGEHRDEIFIVFDGAVEDLLFSIVGHDVDYSVELSVSLNDGLLGFLGNSRNNRDNRGDTFLIPASAMSSGPNQLRIQQLVSGSKWGVTDLLLSPAHDITGPPVSLTVGKFDWGAYGWNFGTNLHLTEVVATFERIAEPLYLFVLGYDLEFAGEVTVWLNGSPLGSLRRGKESSLNRWSRFEVRAEDQVSGINEIRFRKGLGDSTWGIALPILWQPAP